jgi:hypothetical protein
MSQGSAAVLIKEETESSLDVERLVYLSLVIYGGVLHAKSAERLSADGIARRLEHLSAGERCVLHRASFSEYGAHDAPESWP